MTIPARMSTGSANMNSGQVPIVSVTIVDESTVSVRHDANTWSPQRRKPFSSGLSLNILFAKAYIPYVTRQSIRLITG